MYNCTTLLKRGVNWFTNFGAAALNMHSLMYNLSALMSQIDYLKSGFIFYKFSIFAYISRCETVNNNDSNNKRKLNVKTSQTLFTTVGLLRVVNANNLWLYSYTVHTHKCMGCRISQGLVLVQQPNKDVIHHKFEHWTRKSKQKSLRARSINSVRVQALSKACRERILWNVPVLMYSTYFTINSLG